MSEYSVELLQHLILSQHSSTSTEVIAALRAFQERIKADEGAVVALPIPVSIDTTHPNQAYVTFGFADEDRRKVFVKAVSHHDSQLFARPPAQAPQVDAEGRLGEAIRSLIRGDIKCSDDLPEDARPKHASARRAFAAVHALLQEKRAHTAQPVAQATTCAGCGKHKNTPLRIDAMGGYVCLTCIDNKLGSLLGEFGYPEEPAAQGEMDELIAAYDEAVRSQSESGLLPPLAQQAARDCVSHNRNRLRKAIAAQPRALLDAKAMAYRFMGWRLPDDEWNKNKTWPVGTNLFTVDQAEQMFRYVLAAAPQPGESA